MLKRFSLLFLVITVFLGGVPSAFADESAKVLVNLMLKKGMITPDEAVEVLADLEEMEGGPSALTEDQEKALKRIPKKGALVAGMGKKMEIFGYLQADAYFGDTVLRPEDRFDIRRARLGVKGEIIDDLKYKVLIDGADNDDILRDAYIEYVKFDEFAPQVGQFKIPFGQEELTSSSKIHTIERSRLTNSIAPSRDRGFMVSGEFFDGFLEYSAGIFNGAGINTGNDNDEYLYAGRLVLTPYKGEIAGEKSKFQVGGSIASSEDDGRSFGALGFRNFTGDRELYGLDGLFSWGPLTLRGEYLRAELEFDGIAATATTPAVAAADSDIDGFYVIGSYFLNPRWEFAAKWEEFEGDTVADFDALTLGLNYYFHDWDKKSYPTRLMVNYVHGDQDGSSEEDQVLVRMQVGF